jgi:hypothetical protein
MEVLFMRSVFSLPLVFVHAPWQTSLLGALFVGTLRSRIRTGLVLSAKLEYFGRIEDQEGVPLDVTPL